MMVVGHTCKPVLAGDWWNPVGTCQADHSRREHCSILGEVPVLDKNFDYVF